eukprot:CAMPEP_0201480426 /NCGR_PEP_ID=MMETSP0151_2-20130828/4910_1 /ASSEMBLY_ACC=CAM_ASM_000257 /TAXON_ID=200890 /ORGANISM="Paramoeba atlantica, Strain 621/1 / CCAP 1560/9" /LENGTH=1011 /DNA_ID=CAMNT_0047862269 /DNA_START=34 /DNA_END=3069 /DNA_ORIENTATION=-
MAAEQPKEIDHDLYSRQYYVYGKEAMDKMANSHVLISGLGGLGVEIAKNVALAGVKELVLHDVENVSNLDLSSHFFAEGQIGKNRAVISAARVKELNPYTDVSSNTSDFYSDLSFLKKFTVVCLCNQPLSKQFEVGKFCHENKICFISAESRGLFTAIFVDVGENFTIYDKDGEEAKECMIGSIIRGKKTTVKCLPKQIHQMEVGDWVSFREIQGPDALNGPQYYVIESVPKDDEIVINFDSSDLPDYVEATGVIQQKKEVIQVSHKSIDVSYEDPTLIPCDYCRFEAPPQVFLGWKAINQFYNEKGRWPEPWNEEEANLVVSMAEKISLASENKFELNKDVVKLLSFVWQGELSPLSTVVGGIAGQEVLKGVSGKFTPLEQHMLLDFRDLAPTKGTSPSGSRYDAQNIAIGAEMTEQLQNLRLFMVGAGAIGCELLKTVAMMGCCTGPKGLITITDDDHIERSNLNRQFLFRDKHISHPKSLTAKNSVLEMNPDIQVDAHKRRVDKNTEDVYSDHFIESLDCVLNALDNVEARKYVDNRITLAQRPLLESGTMGTKGHVQTIVPFITETYSQQTDPTPKGVAICTLKYFPHEINHCVQFARAEAFERQFGQKPQLFNNLVSYPDVINYLRTSPKARELKPWEVAKLTKRQPNNFQDCVNYARNKWEKYFNHEPKKVLAKYPPEHTLDGKPFWTNPKRMPHPLDFDCNDPLHRQFIVSSANLWAFIWKLPQNRDEKAIMEMCASSPVPKYIPRNKNIPTDETLTAEKLEEEKNSSITDEDVSRSIGELEKFLATAGKVSMEPVKFEKDDDSNFHIDWINSMSNLRANVYLIPNVDRHQSKKIAGSIIPAIAATTAVVSGFAAAELIKIVQKRKTIDDYRSFFFNLAIPQFTVCSPGEVKKEAVTKKLSTTIWDRWSVNRGNITMQEFLDAAQDILKTGVNAVFLGSLCLYNSLMPTHRKKLPMKMSELVKGFNEAMTHIDLLCVVDEDDEEEEDEDADDDAGGAVIRFHFK